MILSKFYRFFFALCVVSFFTSNSISYAQTECYNTPWSQTPQWIGIQTGQGLTALKPLHIDSYYDGVGGGCVDASLRLSYRSAQPIPYLGHLSLKTPYNDPLGDEYSNEALEGDVILTANSSNLILSTKSQYSSIKFCTTPVEPGPDIERVRINPLGHVGIFQTDPKEALHIGKTMCFHTGANYDFLSYNMYLDPSSVKRNVIDGPSYAMEMINDGRFYLVSGGFGLMQGNVSYDETNGGLRGMKMSIDQTDDIARFMFGTENGTARMTIEGLSASATTNAFQIIQGGDGAGGGNEELFTVRDDGNVGIGFKNPTSRLALKGAGTTSATLAMHLMNSVKSSLFLVRDDGNIGINNTSPTSRLTIKGSGSDNTTSALDIANSTGSDLFLVRDDGNIGINNTTPTSRLTIKGSGSDNTTSALDIANSTGSDLFLVRDDGNIGINNTTPTSRLTIKGSGSDNTTSALDIANSTGSNIFFIRDDGKIGIGNNSPDSRLLLKGLGNNSTTMAFKIVNSDNSLLLNINDAGNMGLGFNNPNQKLAVNGKVRIGTSEVEMTSQYYYDYMLSVDGTVLAEKVVVSATDWADHVFNPDYKLKSLDELEEYIKQNGKLPEVPSESDVKDNGIDIAKTNAILLQKIEELTLYIIELKNENKEIKEKLNETK